MKSSKGALGRRKVDTQIFEGYFRDVFVLSQKTISLYRDFQMQTWEEILIPRRAPQATFLPWEVLL